MERQMPQGSRHQITEKASAECAVFAEKAFVSADRAVLSQIKTAVARIFGKLPDVEVKQEDPPLKEESFK